MNPMQIAGLGKIHLAQRRAINTFIKRYREDQNRKIRQKIKGRNRGGKWQTLTRKVLDYNRGKNNIWS